MPLAPHVRSILVSLATDPLLTDQERADMLRIAEGRVAVDSRPPLTYLAFAAQFGRGRAWVRHFLEVTLPALNAPRHLHPGPCGIPAGLVDWLKAEAGHEHWRPRPYHRRVTARAA